MALLMKTAPHPHHEWKRQWVESETSFQGRICDLCLVECLRPTFLISLLSNWDQEEPLYPTTVLL